MIRLTQARSKSQPVSWLIGHHRRNARAISSHSSVPTCFKTLSIYALMNDRSGFRKQVKHMSSVKNRYYHNEDLYLPHAYRRHKPDDDRRGSNTKKKEQRRRNNYSRPKVSNVSKAKKFNKKFTNPKPTRRKVESNTINYVKNEMRSLYEIEKDTWQIIHEYEKLLGTSLDPNGEFNFPSPVSILSTYSEQEHISPPERPMKLLVQCLSTDNHTSEYEKVSPSSLIKSEAPFSSVCIKLRQLIAGWTAIRIKDAYPLYDHFHFYNDYETQESGRVRQRNDGPPLPPEKAIYFLTILEHLRKQRSHYIGNIINPNINDDADAGRLSSYMSWVGDFFSSGDNQELQNAIDGVGTLKAHTSPSYTCTTLLYFEVMKGLFNWRNFLAFDGFDLISSSSSSKKKTVRQSRYQRNRTIANVSELMVLCMNQSYPSNPNTCPDIHTYHHLLHVYTVTQELDYAIRSLKLLRNLESGNSQTMNGNTGTEVDALNSGRVSSGDLIAEGINPTIATYNLVLEAFMQIVKLRNSPERMKAFSQLYILFSEIESYKQTSRSNNSYESVLHVEEDESFPPNGPSIKTYEILLSSLKELGYSKLPDIHKRTDNIMKSLLYPRHEDSLYSNRVNSKILHLLFDIYSSCPDPIHLEKTKTLLKAIEEGKDKNIRKNNYGQLTVKQYNNFLRSINLNIQKQTEKYRPNSTGLYIAKVKVDQPLAAVKEDAKKSEFTSSVSSTNYPTPQKDCVSFLVENSNYASGLLESMIDNGIMPNRTTFHELLKIWYYSGLKEAGRKSSSIISTMKVYSTFHPNIAPSSTSYALALKSWIVSAAASEKNVSSQSLYLLDRMQCSTEKEEICVPTEQHFEAVISACSRNSLGTDKEQAITIAFAVYNQMMDREMIPSSYCFQRLLWVTTFFPDLSKTSSLSETVFNAAIENKRVTNSMLSMLRKVNPSLHEKYISERNKEKSDDLTDKC